MIFPPKVEAAVWWGIKHFNYICFSSPQIQPQFQLGFPLSWSEKHSISGARPINTLSIYMWTPLHLARAVMQSRILLEAWRHFLRGFLTRLQCLRDFPHQHSHLWGTKIDFLSPCKWKSRVCAPCLLPWESTIQPPDQLEKLVQGEPSRHLWASH